ncbi:MAG: amidohydrolase [Pirellulaceae bacterium]|nr:amidohydrolase [Pirellulaceae bacterium]
MNGDRDPAAPILSQERKIVEALDNQLAHVWMVRTFLKHSEEAEEDEELRSVSRDLYDVCLAVGPALATNDDKTYLRQMKKKWSKLRKTTELYLEIQPEISGHTNFKMAARSLEVATGNIETLLAEARLAKSKTISGKSSNASS